MKNGSRIVRRLCVGSLAAAAALTFGASSASAETITSLYPFQANASNFAHNQGGWAPEISLRGICVLGGGITCPNIIPTYQASGGADGPADGFIRIGVISLLDVASDAKGIWRSPPFLYTGARGHTPEKLVFKLTRQADVSSFISLPGNTATYTVQLVNTKTGNAINLIHESNLDGAKTWSAVEPVSVDPDDLRMDAKYRIEIIAHFASVAVVIPLSAADFDNVRLLASRPSDGKDNVVTNTKLMNLLRPLGPKNAPLKGKRLKPRISCPAKVTDPCEIAVSALLSRGGPKITTTRDVTVKPGASKRIGLVVKDQYLQQLRNRGKAVIHERVRSGNARASVYKKIRVR